MKLITKILSSLLSFVMIFSAVSVSVFADRPNNLEECCAELDKILTPEEKEKIKQLSGGEWDNLLAEIYAKPLGSMITLSWLYSEADFSVRRFKRSELAESILFQTAHLRFKISDFEMTAIILENYSHHLNGEMITRSVEDLWVDHWHNRFPNLTRDVIKERLRKGIDPAWGSDNYSRSKSWCTIL